ncbi:arginine/serine-rich coiled-coil protein 2-like [Nematostella vectensis]|nr:arginine/serine-rich coiled-coil protein 2-like [Nematostella vectensis]
MPGYLNPAVVNPQQYKVQQEKKKLLWSGKKKEAAAPPGQWSAASYTSEMDPKFRRLMGIKGGEAQDSQLESTPAAAKPEGQGQSELLHNLEIEFERSRAFQLSRGAGGKSGIGLGYQGPKFP